MTTVHIPDELHKKVKIYAAENDIKIQEAYKEILKQFFEDQ